MLSCDFFETLCFLLFLVMSSVFFKSQKDQDARHEQVSKNHSILHVFMCACLHPFVCVCVCVCASMYLRVRETM
jgi:hypothetical protein